MIAERRNERRYEVCLDAHWEGIRGNASVRLTDLSEGGCYIDAIAEAKKGESLQLRIKLPGGETLLLNGEVAHAMKGVGFGFRFVNLDSEQQEKLREVLNSLRGSEEVPSSQKCA